MHAKIARRNGFNKLFRVNLDGLVEKPTIANSFIEHTCISIIEWSNATFHISYM
jgi:hypothetical protein